MRQPQVAAALNGDFEGTPAAGSRLVRVRLLGGFGVECDGRPLDVPLSAQRLVAFLALQDRPLLRLYVAGVLWPDASEKRSYARLRSALWRLRKAGPEVIEAKAANLRLAPGVTVDARDAVAAAHATLAGDAVPAGTTKLLGADLVPDWYDEWIVDERDRLRELRLHALEALAERLTAVGSFAFAAEAGHAALRSDPLRESAHRAVIRVLLAEGNPAEAVRRYRRYSDLLLRELGLEPSERMHALFADVDVRL